MSTSEVVKKRGRPKKVVDEKAEMVVEVKKTTTRKASTKTAARAGKGEPDAQAVEKGAKKSVGVRKRTEKAKGQAEVQGVKSIVEEISRTTKEDPKTAVKPPKQPTSITQTTSKILQEVASKGALKAANSSTAQSTTPPKPTTPSQPPQPTAQTSPPNPTTTVAPTPSSTNPSTKPPARTTTIPLPSKPRDPYQPSSIPPTSTPRPFPYGSKIPPPSTSNPTAASNLPPSGEKPVEPVPDINLPKKYKPAARRVTAIMVATPIVLVLGYELYQRFFRGKEVKTLYRFSDQHLPAQSPASLSSPSAGEKNAN
ncbi:hypothetical protein K469DRAFT_755359 [Zopfia rhizophila CBS 207.26]|uniref:Uncharacterized protein n=1 Tax=Zopfia rhizophila CBS 207.26 TaxID=1314779 RepID=A0A6A6DBQ3_9PEZI|nr:hypothetical protein K469DRAFT_755359 [Zopfia rhizophila CBS 207.26]